MILSSNGTYKIPDGGNPEDFSWRSLKMLLKGCGNFCFQSGLDEFLITENALLFNLGIIGWLLQPVTQGVQAQLDLVGNIKKMTKSLT